MKTLALLSILLLSACTVHLDADGSKDVIISPELGGVVAKAILADK